MDERQKLNSTLSLNRIINNEHSQFLLHSCICVTFAKYKIITHIINNI